jgi:hypothetical protein
MKNDIIKFVTLVKLFEIVARKLVGPPWTRTLQPHSLHVS